MFHLNRISDFFRELSDSPSLKFKLAWSTFGLLALPTAFFMSVGIPAKYALIAMSLLILPCQYTVYRFLSERMLRASLPREIPGPSFSDWIEKSLLPVPPPEVPRPSFISRLKTPRSHASSEEAAVDRSEPEAAPFSEELEFIHLGPRSTMSVRRT